MPTGRFAPSPTGRLHLGNLRTALVAWLAARVDGSGLWLRYDDLDAAAVREEHYETQAADLQAIGLEWDGPPIRQRDRLDHYHRAIDQLVEADLTYPCYCSRREIREAAQAPNRPLAGHGYPGTCRDLSAAARAARVDEGRPPALRLRAAGTTIGFDDLVVGAVEFEIDDFVVRRNDGTPAYHVVTVVDDADMNVDVVVRADDLLDSTSRQHHVARLLGLAPAATAHVPLVLGPGGERLAKRDGAVTLADRAALGERPGNVLAFLASTLGLCHPDDSVTAADLIDRFDLGALPAEPLVLDGGFLAGPGQKTSSDSV